MKWPSTVKVSRIVLWEAITVESRPEQPGAWTLMLLIDGVEVCASQSMNAAGDVARREFGAWGGPR